MESKKPTTSTVSAPSSDLLQKAAQAPEVSIPTMTTSSAIPRPPVETVPDAAELADDIHAAPMIMPDFIKIRKRNPNVEFRWINFKAGEGLRFAQAQAMGFVVATQQDVAVGELSPYVREGGTKYVNGDLILMKIDRKRYLGALRHKHEVAAALADDGIQRTLSARGAARELANAGANRQSLQGKISVFTPDAADLAGTPLADRPDEVSRLGGTRDIGR